MKHVCFETISAVPLQNLLRMRDVIFSLSPASSCATRLQGSWARGRRSPRAALTVAGLLFHRALRSPNQLAREPWHSKAVLMNSLAF